MDRYKRYLKERWKWVKAGKPYRTDEEIEQIFEICSSCPFFEAEKDRGTCGLCGCNIKKSGHALNKAAWGTTKCPDDPPRW